MFNKNISYWGMPIKTATSYHCTLTIMAKRKSIDNIKCWQGCRATGTLTLHTCECKMAKPLWTMVCQFLLNVHKPFDPEILSLDIYHREMKTYIHIKTCTCMFIATAVIITKHLKWANILHGSYFRILLYFGGALKSVSIMRWYHRRKMTIYFLLLIKRFQIV